MEILPKPKAIVEMIKELEREVGIEEDSRKQLKLQVKLISTLWYGVLIYLAFFLPRY